MTGLTNKTLLAIFILFLTLLCKCHLVSGKEKKGLYIKTDAVFIVDNENFAKLVLGSSSAWLVEFYNSWCGHCVKFAPTFKKLARQLIGWRPVVSLGAVDCANKNNTDLCRSHNVKAFPSFKLFKPFAMEKDESEPFHQQDPEELTNIMIDFVSNTSILDPPTHWPKLAPILSMHDIWDETKDDHKHVAFVFEKEGSYLGRKIILDTLQYKALLVRRMVEDGVKKFGISTFPSLYLINRDGTFTRLAKKNNTCPGMVEALISLLGPDIMQEARRVEMEIEQSEKEEEEKNKQDTDISPGVYMADLESTLHFCFYQEVAINRDINGDKLLSLIQFINVLAKYFPGRPEVVHYLQRVMVWLRGMGTDLTGDQWVNGLDEQQSVSDYLPERVEWVGCQGSENRYRGYPCGMWTLFHTLTVSAAQSARENPRDLSLDVLGAIKGYMKHFFGCQICVEHFLKMADTITSTDKQPHAAVLWLWRAHNKANARLAGDISEDPKHPKVQFPAESLCPQCYTDDGKMDEDKVFTFLLGFYGADAIHPADDGVENMGTGSQEGGVEAGAGNRNKGLDWWEMQQRKKDLEKIQALRVQKMEKNKVRKELRQKGFRSVKQTGPIREILIEADGKYQSIPEAAKVKIIDVNLSYEALPHYS